MDDSGSRLAQKTFKIRHIQDPKRLCKEIFTRDVKRLFKGQLAVQARLYMHRQESGSQGICKQSSGLCFTCSKIPRSLGWQRDKRDITRDIPMTATMHYFVWSKCLDCRHRCQIDPTQQSRRKSLSPGQTMRKYAKELPTYVKWWTNWTKGLWKRWKGRGGHQSWKNLCRSKMGSWGTVSHYVDI